MQSTRYLRAINNVAKSFAKNMVRDAEEHSQDDHKKNSTKVQELTDKLIKEIDALLAQKDTEINKV